MQIISCGGRPRLIQSKAYREYEKDCLQQITGDMQDEIAEPMEVSCLYYLKNKRKTAQSDAH